ncbi:hypothetical protein PP707_02980 [Acetobacter pasteurianus]|nr:hypothetical protein [Acetobacter pasteurianus]
MLKVLVQEKKKRKEKKEAGKEWSGVEWEREIAELLVVGGVSISLSVTLSLFFFFVPSFLRCLAKIIGDTLLVLLIN